MIRNNNIKLAIFNRKEELEQFSMESLSKYFDLVKERERINKLERLNDIKVENIDKEIAILELELKDKLSVIDYDYSRIQEIRNRKSVSDSDNINDMKEIADLLNDDLDADLALMNDLFSDNNEILEK